MPELPEVETTRLGIQPHLEQRRIQRLLVRERRLRWPVPDGLEQLLADQPIISVRRRAKYLLLETGRGWLILHLGMSGSLRVLPASTAAEKHDHLDLILDNGNCLRLRDPRRFGALLWQDGEVESHPLLRELGPEPLSPEFTAEHLHRLSHKRRVAVKNLIMSSKVVVGVGNIYASEALFAAGIHPARASGRISLQRYQALVEQIKTVLQRSIEQGGTSLRDFTRADGNPGYFKQSLQVYGREGENCPVCGHAIRQSRIGQRSSFYCGHCQH